MGSQMFRAIFFAALVFASVPAVADQHLATIRAGDTAQMTVGTTQAIAFYTTDRKGMQVTIVFTDSEGETLRSRVRLDDGQTHAVVLEADEDTNDAFRFSVRRSGDIVEMTGEEVAENTTLAARY